MFSVRTNKKNLSLGKGLIILFVRVLCCIISCHNEIKLFPTRSVGLTTPRKHFLIFSECFYSFFLPNVLFLSKLASFGQHLNCHEMLSNLTV